ncbi:hypothetical protein SB717_36415, partial [Priestia sp. SIMBA_032]|uniref:hypothetical protein n=1 Tax=Priestia sp. SIMBA_032 TaxID=3085775 RepID=UPI003979DCF7
LFNRLVDEINKGNISFDDARNVAGFLAGTKESRSTLHEYANEKNLFKAVKAYLNQSELSFTKVFEVHCPNRRKKLEENSLALSK